MKNKKFRNYINLHKKSTEGGEKKQKEDSSPLIKDFLTNEAFSKTFVSLNNPYNCNNPETA